MTGDWLRRKTHSVQCGSGMILFLALLSTSVAGLRAATPPSGTVPGSTFSYTGSDTVVNAATFDPSNCQTLMYCDVFTLTVNASNSYRSAHPNFRIFVDFSWSGNTNEFDMYVYNGSTVVATSANSFVTAQHVRLEHPANGTYTIYSSQSLGVPGTIYTGTVTTQANPPAISTVAASYTADPDGKFGPQMFQFTPDLNLVASPPTGSAGQDVEPGIQIDPFGNIYISAIEGVPSGSDLWRSTDFGSTFTYLGQPDQSVGGGDEDLGLGAPFVSDPVFGDSTGRLYYSSLNLADINLQTSANMGNTFLPGDSPAKVEDRQWFATAGTARDYLQTVQVGADLVGTSSIVVTESDDGGVTYPHGALVTSILTPIHEGFHSNMVATPAAAPGTPNSSIYFAFTSPDAVDLYVAKCAAPCNLPALPQGAPPPGQNFTSTLVFTAPPGATVGNVFTPMAVDDDGGVYLAFSMQQLDFNGNQTGQNVYLMSSSNGGATWNLPIQINNPADSSTVTSMLPWIVAGEGGLVGMFWYGTNIVGDPNNQGTFANAKWKIFYALVNTAAKKPSVQYVVASGTASGTGTTDQQAGMVHYGSICTQGLNCNLSQPPGNRELAEYAEVANDPFGFSNITFSEDDVSAGSAFTWYTKQTAGPALETGITSGAGSFPIGSGTGNFGFNIEQVKRSSDATISYLDTSAHVLMTAASVTSVNAGSSTLTFSGTGTLQGGTQVQFTVTATYGGPGAGTFSISWAGYQASGTITQGNIVP